MEYMRFKIGTANISVIGKRKTNPTWLQFASAVAVRMGDTVVSTIGPELYINGTLYNASMTIPAELDITGTLALPSGINIMSANKDFRINIGYKFVIKPKGLVAGSGEENSIVHNALMAFDLPHPSGMCWDDTVSKGDAGTPWVATDDLLFTAAQVAKICQLCSASDDPDAYILPPHCTQSNVSAGTVFNVSAVEHPTVAQECADYNVSVADAEAACAVLKNEGAQIYLACQMEFCAATLNIQPTAQEMANLAVEQFNVENDIGLMGNLPAYEDASLVGMGSICLGLGFVLRRVISQWTGCGLYWSRCPFQKICKQNIRRMCRDLYEYYRLPCFYEFWLHSQ
jgi:hypothetical protein